METASFSIGKHPSMFLENKVSGGINRGWKNIAVLEFKMVEVNTLSHALKIVKAVLFLKFF